MQSSPSLGNPAGLVQVGHLRIGSSYSMACGSGLFTGQFIERQQPGGTNYNCDKFAGTFGTPMVFNIRHYAGLGWRVIINGAFAGPYYQSMGFTQGNPFVWGEYIEGGLPPSELDAYYGPLPGGPGWHEWQYTYTESGSPVWNGISSANAAGHAPFDCCPWSASPPPAPFTINYS